VIQQIPGWSTTLPPRRNLFAEPIALGGSPEPGLASVYHVLSPIPVSKVTTDPVKIEIAELGLQLRLPTRSIDTVILTPEEQDRWAVLMGKDLKLGGLALHERLSKLVQGRGYTGQSDDRKSLLIKEVVDQYRQGAQERLLQEYPDLRTEILKVRRERTRAQAPTRGVPPRGPAAPGPASLTPLVRGLTS
jgi:hypothetical protein